jgi:2-ketocyclohexanecarboxyl-CoA hydrolase
VAFSKTHRPRARAPRHHLQRGLPGPDRHRAVGRCTSRAPATREAARGLPQRSIPLGRIGQPDDLPGAILFFASDDAAYHRPGAQRLRRPDHERLTAMTYEDILNFEDMYEVRNGVAWITINRPDKMNAFRGRTCDELIHALNKAGYDNSIGCIVLAGAGDRAFCTGGDQSAHDGKYDGRGTIGLPMEELHTAIRDVPKPVIARVQGLPSAAATCCARSATSPSPEKAQFGQVGPKVGSVDPGYGTAFWPAWWARRRRARSGTCAAATRQEALAMGLANAGAARELDAEVSAGRRDLRAQPDRHRDRQAQLQHGHRAPGRHRRHGHVCAQALLRHRGIARGRERASRKSASPSSASTRSERRAPR